MEFIFRIGWFFSVSNPDFFLSWLASLSYMIQLYFDFSGYSDMAIGLSLLFGIFLPWNFNSPLKSISIIDLPFTIVLLELNFNLTPELLIFCEGSMNVLPT